MLEAWRHRRGDVLTLAAYEASGGVGQAVARTAESVYSELDDQQRRLARDVLLRLVTIGEGVPDTRRRVPRGELVDAVDPVEAADLGAVLRGLAAARLVVIDGEAVELAHEALIGAWPRLHEWLHTDRDELRRRRELAEAARLWQADGADPGTLYRGARLAAWERTDPERLGPTERAFLAAGLDARAAARRSRRRWVATGAAGLAIALVAVSVLATVALVQGRRADSERRIAVSRQLAGAARDQLQIDPQAGLALAERAYDTAPTFEARTALQ